MRSIDTSVQTNSNHAGQAKAPIGPFWYKGGDLAFTDSDEPWIYFVDSTGQEWLTHSVETLLRVIDQFEDCGRGGRDQLLAAAALYYGMDVWALIKGYDFVPREEYADE